VPPEQQLRPIRCQPDEVEPQPGHGIEDLVADELAEPLQRPRPLALSRGDV
jgi:hypothetical protein